MRAFNRRLSAALLVVLLAERAQAQMQAGLSVSGGSATDVRGITSRAVTVAPSVTFAPDPRGLIVLGANGTRFDNSQWAAGATLAGAARSTAGKHVALSMAANAGATRTSYEFSYATVDVAPQLELSAGALSGFVAVRGSAATTATVRETQSAPGPFGGTPLSSRATTSSSRTAGGLSFGGSARITGSDGTTLVAGVREEHTRVDTLGLVDRGVSLSAMNGRLTLGGSFGIRSENGARGGFGNGSLSIAVNQAAAIELNAGSYPTNHLIGTPAGRYVNLGLSLRTGRLMPRLPSAEGAPSPLAGFTRLTIRAPAASRVEIAGDFTNWKAIAAKRASNGVWFADLRIPPGQYRYAFRVDGSAWQVPEGATVVDDDLGGKSAVLVVSTPK